MARNARHVRIAPRFIEDRVDFSVLADLTDQDLKDLGVVPGDRRKLLRAIRERDDAGRCIGEALTAIDTTKERWCEAEVCRIAGAVVLMSPEADPAQAEARFEQALSVARDQQARPFELRAATSMVRLWRDRRRRRQARDLLAAVFARFTEGDETGDLSQARVLLDGLAV